MTQAEKLEVLNKLEAAGVRFEYLMCCAQYGAWTNYYENKVGYDTWSVLWDAYYGLNKEVEA